MLMGSEISSGLSLSQWISGVGTPSATAQDNVTLPPLSASPSHWHAGSEGGATEIVALTSQVKTGNRQEQAAGYGLKQIVFLEVCVCVCVEERHSPRTLSSSSPIPGSAVSGGLLTMQR